MKGRLVDLSHTLRPGGERRLMEVERLQANQVDDLPLLPGQWYIMHNVKMVTHIGTHIECPFHINEDGADTSAVPLERLVGEAVILDLRGMAPRTEISLAQMQAAVEKGGGIQPGDFALFHTGWDQYYGTPQYKQSPYPSPDAVRWIVAQGVGLTGIDTSGAEVPGNVDHVNHHAMLDHGVPHLENLCNMSSLKRSRVMLFAAPIAVEGLESMPVRVVALESEE